MTRHSLIAGALLAGLLTPALTFAQSASVGATAAVDAAGTHASVDAAASAKLDDAKSRADKEIDRRIAALNDMNTRVGAMQQVTAAFKQGLAANVSTQIQQLTALKAKIDADADVSTLKTDVRSIADNYRIFMLVMPQSRIAAAADREVTLITMLNQLGAKLQTRLAASASSGANTSQLMATLKDMSDKLSDAGTQAQAAVSVSATLTPDNGDKTKMAQNTAALKTARADIQAAQKDLVTARQDAQTIITALKTLDVQATTTTQVQTQTQTQ